MNDEKHRYAKRISCNKCSGKGEIILSKTIACKVCTGGGWIIDKNKNPTPCPSCRGDGSTQLKETCPTCSGDGHEVKIFEDSFRQEKCQECSGLGTILASCPSCRGDGSVYGEGPGFLRGKKLCPECGGRKAFSRTCSSCKGTKVERVKVGTIEVVPFNKRNKPSS